MRIIAETPRLKIFVFEVADVPMLMDLSRKPGISDFAHSRYDNFTDVEAKDFIEKELSRFGIEGLAKFGIWSKEMNQPVGICGLFRQEPPYEKDVEINYRFPKPYRGWGYATEAGRALRDYAIEELKLTSICAFIQTDNENSKNVAERIGMVCHGPFDFHGELMERWMFTASND